MLIYTIMNIFKRPKPQIEFFTSDWATRKHYPIKLARDCFPEYWKRMPGQASNKQDTVKKCPGIGDWLTSGYIISLWTDVDVVQGGEYGPDASLNNGATGAAQHPPYQCQDMLTQKSHHHGSIKLPGTWHIKTSPGWSIMIVPLWYWKDQPWEVMPGIIHSDNHHCEVNLNMILKSTESQFTVQAGTPLAQIIPFKRDSVSGVSRAMDNNDIKRHNIILRMYNWTKNGVTKFYKQKTSYSLEEHDLDFEESLKYPIEN